MLPKGKASWGRRNDPGFEAREGVFPVQTLHLTFHHRDVFPWSPSWPPAFSANYVTLTHTEESQGYVPARTSLPRTRVFLTACRTLRH